MRKSNGRGSATSTRRSRGDASNGRVSADAGGELRFATGACALGTVLVATTGRGLSAVVLADDRAAAEAELSSRFPGHILTEGGETVERMLSAVLRSIGTPGTGFNEPLDVGGTAFQRSVWEELRRIPVGETVTYAEIARRIGRPGAVRAVGAACGANPVAVVVPCHRVVGSTGALTGYRWGVERKRRLLDLESRVTEGVA